MKRFLWMTLLCTAAACGGSKNNGSGDDECEINADCPVGQNCVDKTCAEANCLTGLACSEGTTCNIDTKSCETISQICNTQPCTCHVLNSTGELEADPANPAVLSLAAGESIALEAVLASPTGPLPGATFQYTIDDNGENFSLAEGNLTALATAGTTTPATVTANAGNGVTCTAKVTNIGEAPSGGVVRVMLVDALSSDPITGATFVLDHDNDGISDVTLDPDLTHDGVYLSAAPIEGDYTLTVFAMGYNILSIVGLSPGQLADLVLPMSPRPSPPTTGGFTGRPGFDSLRQIISSGKQKEFQFGLFAPSLGLGNLFNADLGQLLGNVASDCASENEAGCYGVNIPSLNINTVTGLPGGLVFNLATTTIKSHFDVAATPGRRFAWGLGGEVGLGEIGDAVTEIVDFMNCSCDNAPSSCDSGCSCDSACPGVGLPFGDIFNSITPLFALFGSGIRGNLGLPEVPLSEWEDHIRFAYGPDRTADPKFPNIDGSSHEDRLIMSKPLTSGYTLFDAPQLPLDPSNAPYRMEGMILLTGADSPGYGFVPLGLGVGLDCTTNNCLDPAIGDFDGVVNGSSVCVLDTFEPKDNTCPEGVMPEVPAGQMGLFHAARHSGVQDADQLTVALALPVSAIFDGGGGLRVLGIVHRGELPERSTTNILTSTGYPGFPQMPANVAGRTYVATPAADVDMHWVTLASKQNSNEVTTRWNVYFASNGGTFKAPAVPASMGFLDPFTNTDPELNGECSQSDPNAPCVDSTHVGLRFSTGMTLQDFVARAGTNLTQIVRHVDGFSVQNIGRSPQSSQ